MGSEQFCSYACYGKIASCGGNVAREAVVEVEHAAAPLVERRTGGDDVLRAGDARPLEEREEDVVAIRRRGAADERLALEHRLPRLELALEALARFFAPRAGLLERRLEEALELLAEVGVIARIDALIEVGDDYRHQQREERAVGPGIERLRHAAADGAAEERWPVRIAIFQVFGDLPRVPHHARTAPDNRHVPR